MSLPGNGHSGALNLLQNCMGVQPEEKVLLICEKPALGWYDQGAAEILAETLKGIGAQTMQVQVGGPDDALPPDYEPQIERHGTIIYLARIGDQDRFHDKLPGKNVAMLYARDSAALSSAFASTSHAAMKDFKEAVDRVTLSARSITITCALGTNLECAVNSTENQPGGDVAVKRFPLCVPQPVLANATSGRVALSGWLTPTGSRSYHPPSCKIDGVVFAMVDNGRISGFDGDPKSVTKIEAHYERVSSEFGIDKSVVHSWHAGIHPACTYESEIGDNPDRWSNSIFGSPRFVHFHTCGNYPPGEICWMVADPTIAIDGVALWQCGQLKPKNFATTADAVNRWPALRRLIEETDNSADLK